MERELSSICIRSSLRRPTLPRHCQRPSRQARKDFLQVNKIPSSLGNQLLLLIICVYWTFASTARAASRVADLEAQLRKVSQELAEYKAESTQIKNQDLTIRKLEEKVRVINAMRRPLPDSSLTLPDSLPHRSGRSRRTPTRSTARRTRRGRRLPPRLTPRGWRRCCSARLSCPRR